MPPPAGAAFPFGEDALAVGADLLAGAVTPFGAGLAAWAEPELLLPEPLLAVAAGIWRISLHFGHLPLLPAISSGTETE